MLPVFIVKHSSRTSLITTDQQTRGGDGHLQISMFTSKHESTRVMFHNISVADWRWQKKCQAFILFCSSQCFCLLIPIAFRENRIRLITEQNDWECPGCRGWEREEDAGGLSSIPGCSKAGPRTPTGPRGEEQSGGRQVAGFSQVTQCQTEDE